MAKIPANDKNSLIYQAVLPLLAASQNRARDAAIAKINELREQLIIENDRQKFAPYPKSGVGRIAYMEALAYYDFVHCLTKSIAGFRISMNAPDTCVIDEEHVEHFIEARMRDAALAFEEYIYKLTKKINYEIVAVELVGNYLWSTSFLTVTLVDGTKQIWKTQMIINFSVYGKMFNQWPTRLVKAISLE